MNLDEWFATPGNTAAKLARATKLAPPEISKIRHGHMSISMRTAIILDRGTNGMIRAEKVCTENADLLVYLREASHA